MRSKLLLCLIVILAFVAGRVNAISSQEGQPSEEDRAIAAQRKSMDDAAKAREQQDTAVRKSLDNAQRESDSRLNLAVDAAARARALANEIRFAAILANSRTLLGLSQRVHDQLQASGAQSISISFFKDLDEIDKTVKVLRKSAK